MPRSALVACLAMFLGLAGGAKQVLAQCPTACQNASFGPALRTLGPDLIYARSVVVADFDGDENPDLAVGQYQGVSVFSGTGGGGFGSRVETDVNDDVLALFVGDLNEDGIPDLVAAGSRGIYILLGGGSGRFSAAPAMAGGSFPGVIGIGDFDGDGHLDVIVGKAFAQELDLLHGDGRGHVSASASFSTGLSSYTTSLAVGDVNGDGRPDVAVGGGGTSVLFGTGSGLGAPHLVSPSISAALLIADVTGDGKPDLVGIPTIFPGNGSGGFGAPLNVPMGDGAASPAAADLNGDGEPDLVAISYQYNRLLIRLGAGGGNFGAIQQWPIGSSPIGLAVADLDGDGVPDFVTANDYSVNVAFGDGVGGVQAAILPMGNEPLSAAIADFDGDGHLDVATVSQGYFRPPTGVSVRYGNGHGGLSPEVRYGAPASSTTVAALDVNNDGRPDLLLSASEGISVLFNDGTGAFLAPATVAPGCYGFGAPGSSPPPAIGDLNGDGNPDLVAHCGTLSVLLGNGTGGFGAPIPVLGAPDVSWAAIGDVNGDGEPDVVVANYSSYQVSTFLGDGTGHFGAPILSTPPHYDVNGLVLGDFDGDGHLDAATSVYSDHQSLDVMFGDGTGSFGASRSLSFPMRGAVVLLALDVNGDGRPDVVAGGGGEILMNDGTGNFLASSFFGIGLGVPAWGDLDEDGLPDLVNPVSQSDSITVLLNTSCKPRHLAVTPLFPSCSPPNAPLTPAPAIRVTDDGDNVVTCAAGTVAASLLSGPAGSVLSGTRTVPVVSGVATFSNLSLNLAGSNYRLHFTHSGVARPTTGAAHVGSGTTVSISGPATICGNNPAAYSGAAGYTRYLWTLDGVPISSEQNAALGYLPAGPHTLALRAWQGDCEALASVSVQNAPPQFNSIAPSSGPAGGGTPITVSGACFASGATLALGGTAASSVNVLSTASLSATTPGHAPGLVAGVVTNPDGQTATLASGYTFVCAVTPTASVTGGAVVCAPTTVHIMVALTGEPPWTLTWSDGYVQPAFASPVQRYVTPTSTTTYSINSVVGNFCPGTSTGEAAVVVQNCPAGTPAGSLIPDGRAVTGTLQPAGNIYVFQPSVGSYGVVEADAPFDGETTLSGGGPAPLLAITRSGGAPLKYPPEFRATCKPDCFNRLFYYASYEDVVAGPLEAHVSDPASSGYKIRVRALETSLFAPRWSVNGYKALADVQNTSDCIVEGYILVLGESNGFSYQSIFFSLRPGASLQNEISPSPSYGIRFGSLKVIHDGPPGALTGGVYMTSPAGGASFRWPLQKARTYGATDGK